MLDEIGYASARGCGSNRHIQQNLGLVKTKLKDKYYKIKRDLAAMEAKVNKKPNKEILEHQRKRKIELKCAKFAEILEERGFPEEIVNIKVNNHRKMLISQVSNIAKTVDQRRRSCVTKTHEMAEAQQEKAKQYDQIRTNLNLDKKPTKEKSDSSSEESKRKKKFENCNKENEETKEKDKKKKYCSRDEKSTVDEKRSKKEYRSLSKNGREKSSEVKNLNGNMPKSKEEFGKVATKTRSKTPTRSHSTPHDKADIKKKVKEHNSSNSINCIKWSPRKKSMFNSEYTTTKSASNDFFRCDSRECKFLKRYGEREFVTQEKKVETSNNEHFRDRSTSKTEPINSDNKSKNINHKRYKTSEPHKKSPKRKESREYSIRERSPHTPEIRYLKSRTPELKLSPTIKYCKSRTPEAKPSTGKTPDRATPEFEKRSKDKNKETVKCKIEYTYLSLPRIAFSSKFIEHKLKISKIHSPAKTAKTSLKSEGIKKEKQPLSSSDFNGEKSKLQKEERARESLEKEMSETDSKKLPNSSSIIDKNSSSSISNNNLVKRELKMKTHSKSISIVDNSLSCAKSIVYPKERKTHSRNFPCSDKHRRRYSFSSSSTSLSPSKSKSRYTSISSSTSSSNTSSSTLSSYTPPIPPDHNFPSYLDRRRIAKK